MTTEDAVRVVQTAYPQIYLACHTRHQRKRSTAHRLSARDATILAHLSETIPMAPARLAKHLSIGRSTVSEALKRLVALGFIARSDGSAAVILTEKGRNAVRDTSVLEAARLEAVLDRLTSAERLTACRGLELLAAACRGKYSAAAWNGGG